MSGRQKNTLLLSAMGIAAILIVVFAKQTLPQEQNPNNNLHSNQQTEPKGCVFKTVFEGETVDSNLLHHAPQKVRESVDAALQFLVKAQQQNGEWGAGTHANQSEMDPHAVSADPATTAMVAMALLRSGSSLQGGIYSQEIQKAVSYLLQEVEKSDKKSSTITPLKGTQIQVKLGENIDVVLTSQFFSNLLEHTIADKNLETRLRNALSICVQKIQRAQDSDGSTKGSGWAGVLQSSFANNALEAAQAKGIAVDTVVLERSRAFHKGNFNDKTGEVNTDKGAGVVLYAVSGSVRASAKEYRKVDEDFKKAKKEGKIEKNAIVNTENLQKIGYGFAAAENYSTAYNVYNSSKVVAQQDNVTSGFGNNGGEEFLSYLQTGESLVIGKDTTWKQWYDKTSSTLLSIQNKDGSWNGHHCITSPVFCTATAMLILTINNDIEKLVAMGGKE